jgi:SAM-dependent methyltransferase
MLIDAGELCRFYEAPIGQVARRLILRRFRRVWPDVKGTRVLGYGFAVPYLKTMLGEAERVIAAMPAHQGAISWPEARNLTMLCQEDALAFPDALFDRIVIVHGLEAADAVRPLMRQIWRVLAPAGRLVVVVPNRTSLWAQVDRSPFAQGRPFSRSQLDRTLRESLFVPETWDSALLVPPLKGRRLVRTGTTWESAGRMLWPRLAGVHIVEASKSLYALATPPAKARKQALAEARA